MEKSYSVLMSVYKKNNVDFLRIAIESMLNQTLKPNDFVIVYGGELPNELENLLNEYKKKYNNIMNYLHLDTDNGLGDALMHGVKFCKNEYIARMDSDDIARPNRCELELNFLNEHQDIAIVGGNIEEFIIEPGDAKSYRVVPEKSEEILKYAKGRNPFNHPTVMYRKQAVLDSGNYKPVKGVEDYYLWVDLLSRGYKGYNIQKVLVDMRGGENLFDRRSGRDYLKLQYDLLKYMKKINFINSVEYSKSLTLRTCLSLAPTKVRSLMFKKVLRKNNKSDKESV